MQTENSGIENLQNNNMNHADVLLHGSNKTTFHQANGKFPPTCSTVPQHINFTPQTSSRLDFGQFQSDNGRLHWLDCNMAQSQCRLSGKTRARVSHLQVLGAVASFHFATIDGGLVFECMFRPATVSVSVHVRAWPRGKQWPARCCVSAKNK
jgi:hypothetical protein